MPFHDQIRAIQWHDNALHLLDQRALPQQETWLELHRCGEVTAAIQDMVVRGAPAIGITAAYGVVLAAAEHFAASATDWRTGFEKDLSLLQQARPTAVNLAWAIKRMRSRSVDIQGDPIPVLLKEAIAIHEEDIQANRVMGELGAACIQPGSSILTHCNAGALATGGYGTALGVVRSAWSDGKLEQVFADETRPWLQGARLTAWELIKEQIPVTLLVEGAAAHLMKQGKVQWVIVGSDRIAANGDVANKIGTYSAAIAARHHGVKFMVAAPCSTIDMEVACGDDIPIEIRASDEVTCVGGQPVAVEGVSVWNPAFDITPASLIDVLVTEKGLIENPDRTKIKQLMGDY